VEQHSLTAHDKEAMGLVERTPLYHFHRYLRTCRPFPAMHFQGITVQDLTPFPQHPRWTLLEDCLASSSSSSDHQ
jgi:hypothetical protein